MENIEIINKIVSNLLEKIGIKADISSSCDYSDDNILVNITTEQINSGFLIGQGGNNLDSLQHLARLLVNKKSNQPIKFVVDVNNYKKHRIDLLKITAQDIAKQVLMEKTSLALRPMPSYERRIIHMALSDNPLINTESVGCEPERRVIVKIKSNI